MARAEVIAHTMALTDTISPELVSRIGEHVASVLESAPKNAFPKPATARVGAILNTTAKDAREKVLEALFNRDATFAGGVKRAIFAFGHIPQRVLPTDIPGIMRDIDQDTIITAIAAGMAEEPMAAEFILENMSKRLAEQIRDDAEARSPPAAAEGNDAMARIIAKIRELEEAGEIKLLVPED